LITPGVRLGRHPYHLRVRWVWHIRGGPVRGADLDREGPGGVGPPVWSRAVAEERAMAVLFLDPLALTLLLGLIVYVGAVWRGRYRRWFGRPERWTVVAWPFPLLVMATPAVAGGVLAMLGVVGVEIGDGGMGDAALYTAAYLIPVVALTAWPPSWLLPPWARRRLTVLPATRPDTPPGACAAVRGRRGHGSAARWVWRVDAVAGHAWIEGQQLRFRATRELDVTDRAVGRPDLDDEAIAELRFSSEGELRLEAPRGGSWGRDHLDVELDQLDRWRARGMRPWRRDGLLTLEVDGRRPLHLWVGDVRGLAARLAAAER
jgi:hypothetical protein